ncbi:hypothetical protein GCM10027037_23350 [Mucilaginibacter koreensis]
MNWFCGVLYMTMAVKAYAQTVPNSPEAIITNGLLQVRVYLPDKHTGYNRGPRFDWAGVINKLQYQGHDYFGKWQDTYNPAAHDAAMGPAEVFDPVGFETAKASEAFIKIGIGALVKPDDQAYDFMKPYAMANSGKWTVTTQANQVQFVQALNQGRYAYIYQKCVQLKPGKPVMLITHTLKNNGRQPINTTVYNHNFFVIDSTTTGPGSVVIFPFNLKENISRDADYIRIDSNQLEFTKELKNKYISFPDLTHGEGSAYHIRVENRKTGAGVEMTGDRPIAKIAFWSSLKTFCPEPYINISLPPGQEISWTLTYTFYTIAH